jgi:hypothetical protein
MTIGRGTPIGILCELVRNEIKLATEERWNDMKLHGRNEGMKE